MGKYRVKCLFCYEYIKFQSDEKEHQYMSIKCNFCENHNIFYFKPHHSIDGKLNCLFIAETETDIEN